MFLLCLDEDLVARTKMSADIRQMKEDARKMKHILADIASIDEKAKRLAKQRERLMLRYEELKDAKLIRDSKAVIVDQDYGRGK